MTKRTLGFSSVFLLGLATGGDADRLPDTISVFVAEHFSEQFLDDLVA